MRQPGAVRTTSDPRAEVVALVGTFDEEDDGRIRDALAGDRPLVIDLRECDEVAASFVHILREARGSRAAAALVLVVRQDSAPWRLLGANDALLAYRIVMTLDSAFALLSRPLLDEG